MISQLDETEKILDSYRSLIGADFDPYRGHCYRLLNYMDCFGLSEYELAICSVAVPFHDIGIWTHQTMNYLPVSAELAATYVRDNEKEMEPELVKNVIVNHHKLTSAQNGLSEKLRKADLIDLSRGVINFGILRNRRAIIMQYFPYRGFQFGIYRKVIKYALSNPLNPLPMMKL